MLRSRHGRAPSLRSGSSHTDTEDCQRRPEHAIKTARPASLRSDCPQSPKRCPDSSGTRADFTEIRTQILPVLHEAREILESEGLEVSITDLDEETKSLGFYVKDVGLFFTPGDDALTLRFMARRFTGCRSSRTSMLSGGRPG